jgi:predicted nucleic acid-binding Zn ribbon protein
VKQKPFNRPQKRRNFYGKANQESMKPLDKVIDQFLRAHSMISKLDEVDVVLAWKEVFGDVIHKKTRHLMLKSDGTLIATLNSGALKEEFSLNKEKIAKMINEHLKRDVVLKVRIR